MTSRTYTGPDKLYSGDNYYGQFICRQDLSDYFWLTYGFDGESEYWDDGFGWENFCDTNKPLGAPTTPYICSPTRPRTTWTTTTAPPC